MSSMQSLKSVNSARVNIAQAHRLHSERENLGQGHMAPASPRNLHDIYGRPINASTQQRLYDAATAMYNKYNLQAFMNAELAQRAYNPISASGLNGVGDFMGVGRDVMPQGIYGDVSGSGNFHRTSTYPNNELPDATSGSTQPQEQFNPRLLAGSYKAWTKGHGANNQAWASKW